MLCDEKAPRVRVTELLLTDGRPCTITQRKLTCGEEQDANDISGYRHSQWDPSRISDFLKKHGRAKVEDVGEDEYAELEKFAKLEGNAAGSREAFEQMVYKVVFSMGGSVDGSTAGGSLGMDEGWTLEEPVTVPALRKLIDYRQLVELFARTNALTYLSEPEVKN